LCADNDMSSTNNDLVILTHINELDGKLVLKYDILRVQKKKTAKTFRSAKRTLPDMIRKMSLLLVFSNILDLELDLTCMTRVNTPN